MTYGNDAIISQIKLDEAAEELLPKFLQEVRDEGLRPRVKRFCDEFQDVPAESIKQLTEHFGYRHRVPFDDLVIYSALDRRFKQLAGLALGTGYPGDYASLTAVTTMAAAAAELDALQRVITCYGITERSRATGLERAKARLSWEKYQ